MERLQQYEFEIVHRKGRLHQNARLSRRLCSELGCAYYARMELKEKAIARIIVGQDNFEEWHNRQIMGESIISMFLRKKELGEHPCWEGVNMILPREFIGLTEMY